MRDLIMAIHQTGSILCTCHIHVLSEYVCFYLFWEHDAKDIITQSQLLKDHVGTRGPDSAPSLLHVINKGNLRATLSQVFNSCSTVHFVFHRRMHTRSFSFSISTRTIVQNKELI